jgi:hypothetical protein
MILFVLGIFVGAILFNVTIRESVINFGKKIIVVVKGWFGKE